MKSILATRIPSTMYKGSELKLLPVPRTLTVNEEPGAPEFCIMVTPAVLPCKACSTRVGAIETISSLSTLAMAPVTRLFFFIPYPTTTSSSNDIISGISNISTLVVPCKG
ncbi:hypothetical protein ES703_114380 [subsurface metagenome]